MTAEIVVSGETEEDALAEVLRRLGLPREGIEFRVETEPEEDLLPGARPQVQVRAWVRAEFVAERAEDRLRRLLEIIGVEYELQSQVSRDIIRLELRAPEDSALLIGRDGQNLNALQFLVNRMAAPSGREVPMILIDVEGYRARQYRPLERLVERAVKRARETGNEIELDPMLPATRKYLHNYLRRFKGVTTFSRGEEPERYLVIIAD